MLMDIMYNTPYQVVRSNYMLITKLFTVDGQTQCFYTGFYSLMNATKMNLIGRKTRNNEAPWNE